MKLKLLSTCGIAVYLLAFMSCTRTAESIELLESKGTAPYQVVLLVNERPVDRKWDDQKQRFVETVWDFAATGVILNKRWVLTAQGFTELQTGDKLIKDVKVIAGDPNFLESETDYSSRYRQVTMVTSRIAMDTMMLIQVANEFYIDGVNIQRVQLPKTWQDETERTFEYGFPTRASKCQVSGWYAEEEKQRVGKVEISEDIDSALGLFKRSGQDPIDYTMVKKHPYGITSRTLTSIYKYFRNNACARGERDCDRLSIVGIPLVCRKSKRDPWILMGVGDYKTTWDSWQHDIAPFARVSPWIGLIREQIQRFTPDLYVYQGIEGQASKFSFQALVKVAYEGKRDKLVHVCQGVILSETRVLTAASCLDDNDKGQAVVRVAVMVGITNLKYANQNNQHEANEWWQYNENDLEPAERQEQLERYDADSDFDFYNMALIGFQQHLPQNDNVKSIDIATSNEGMKGCTVSGWEEIKSGKYDPKIRYRHVEVLEGQRCVSPMLKPNVMQQFFEQHLCLKEKEPGQQARIDPGAPVTCFIGDKVYVVGIASFNGPLERLGGDNGPKIFTGTFAHRAWINSRMN